MAEIIPGANALDWSAPLDGGAVDTRTPEQRAEEEEQERRSRPGYVNYVAGMACHQLEELLRLTRCDGLPDDARRSVAQAEALLRRIREEAS